MKKIFGYSVMALLAAASLALASCEQGGDDIVTPATPNFPDKVEAPMFQGATYTMEFTPNYDCTVSIPRQGWFQMKKDGKFTTYAIAGKVGEKMSIVIYTVNKTEQDDEMSCDVTMTMNGESRVIATLTRQLTAREFTVRKCALDEGVFAPSTDGGELDYNYDDEAVQSVDLIWPEGLNGYSYPIMIEANFNWHVNVDSIPAWLELSKSDGKAGEKVEVRLIGGNELESRTVQLLFCDAYNTEATFPLTVSLPDCTDRFSIDGFQPESLFNGIGELKQDASGSVTWLPAETGASGSVTDIAGTVVYKFALVPDGMEMALSARDEDTAWISVDFEEWKADGGNLQTRGLQITLGTNEGTTVREGLVYALPASVAPEDPNLMFVSGTEIDPAYDAYLVTSIRQVLPDITEGTIITLNTIDMDGYATYSKLADNQKYELEHLVPNMTIPEGYFLHYTSDEAADHTTLKADREYTVKYYDAEYNEMVNTEENPDASWLAVRSMSDADKSGADESEADESGENTFKVIMTPGLDKYSAKNYGCTSDNLGYIVLFDSEGKAFSMLRCEYTEPEKVDRFTASFITPDQVQGASLTKITKSILNNPDAYPWLADADFMKTLNENYATGFTSYVLEYKVESPTSAEISIVGHTMVYDEMSWAKAQDGANGGYVIDMSDKPSSGAMANIQLFGAGWSTIGFIYCIANF